MCGCTSLRGFQPPPGPEDSFRIPGKNTNKKQVIVDLNECGFYNIVPVDYGADWQKIKKHNRDNSYKCMEEKGYRWVD